MSTSNDLPVAVLGFLRTDRPGEWQPSSEIDLAEAVATNVGQPYGCHVSTPQKAIWQRTATHFSFLDLQAVFRPKAAIGLRGKSNCRTLPIPGSAFVLVRVTSESARQVILEVGSQDQLDVHLNGKQIAGLNRPFPAVWDTETVTLDLAEGVNDVVLRTALARKINWSVWVLSLRLLETDGSPATGLVFDDFPALERTPERWREPDPFRGT
jgi:hypothetical protein